MRFERAELIADLRRALELQLRGGLFHALLQLRVHFAAAAFEHLDGRLQVLRVELLGDEPDAGRRTAPDLMLQAGPAAVGEERVPAVADLEELLQGLQRFLHGAGTGKRAEVAAWLAARAAIEREARKIVVFPAAGCTGSSCRRAERC